MHTLCIENTSQVYFEQIVQNMRMNFWHFSLQNTGEKVLVQSCIRQNCFAVGFGTVPHAH
jgi:hypothetical protein